MVTWCPAASSFLARCRPRKAWPPPLVFTIRHESARTLTERVRPERTEAPLRAAVSGTPRAALEDSVLLEICICAALEGFD
jgi:hypothetical protein